ncbi:MAG: molybdopterin synthase sulfur carrier subunit [Gammaproteobacteria bacterium]|jgi:molybdopterin synthase sulfur carrier subunit
MKVSIEFYASLMKYLPPGKSRFRREIQVDDDQKLAGLIKKYQISEEEAHIVLINGHFVCGDDRIDRQLIEGDVVSVWPPVAGG